MINWIKRFSRTAEPNPSLSFSLSEYFILNDRMNTPYVHYLTNRGFFSEVSGLLNAFYFCLRERKRLIVDETRFNNSWNDFFTADLCPILSGSGKDTSWDYRHILKTVSADWRFGRLLSVPELNIAASVFAVKRHLATLLCQPRFKPAPRFDMNRPYAALHVRRGDKTRGYYSSDGRWIVEGTRIDADLYISSLKKRAPTIQDVFVLTDDYTAIEELISRAPELMFHTFCPPEQRGYDQAVFEGLTKCERTDSIRLLIKEVQVASVSSFFAGAYQSNVSRHVVLTHQNPGSCISLDRARKWKAT